jgi:small subunit ribosomal protein S17e
MGRIKTDRVKRTTVKLVQTYPVKFSKSFQKNKDVLKEIAEVRSKKMRNLLAGYAVRLKKKEESQATGVRRRRMAESDEMYPGMQRRGVFGRGRMQGRMQGRMTGPRREEY